MFSLAERRSPLRDDLVTSFSSNRALGPGRLGGTHRPFVLGVLSRSALNRTPSPPCLDKVGYAVSQFGFADASVAGLSLRVGLRDCWFGLLVGVGDSLVWGPNNAYSMSLSQGF